MTVGHTVDEDGKYVCDECGWKGSRSGFYKHRAVHASPQEVESETIPIQEDSTPVEVEESTEQSWMDWGDMGGEDNSTETMPTPLKALNKKAVKSKRSKKTKAEIESARSTSKSLVNLGLTFTDTLMTIWGRGQLLDPDFEVRHSDKDKNLTSDAVVGAMEEKGYFISDSISRTTVATVMVGWYIGSPMYKIQKKSKKSLFKGGRGSGLLSKIPLIGRLFRKKKKPGITVEQAELMSNEG